MNQNLEALIEEHAKIMADQMVKAAAWAESEEDIRHECNKLIDEFIKKAGLTVKGQHEYGLAGGRIDSKYGGVVIEYKDPKGTGKIIENKNAPGVKAVVEQLNRRFRDFQAKEHGGDGGGIGRKYPVPVLVRPGGPSPPLAPVQGAGGRGAGGGQGEVDLLLVLPGDAGFGGDNRWQVVGWVRHKRLLSGNINIDDNWN